ncbi:hypothetical protein AAC387_Pa07g1105 [Persea americana]
MPRAKSPFNRRPPLAASPRRTRSGRILSSTTSIQSPSGAYLTRTQLPNPSRGLEESRIRPEWLSMSCEFQALAKMVEEELGCPGTPFTYASGTYYSPLFERGRMYEVYSARRNERLKRKKRETEEERYVHASGAPVESGKRRIVKKVESVRKSAPASFSIGHREGLRSSARINKENKKPPVSGYGKRL